MSAAADEARQLESGAAALGVSLDARAVGLLLVFLERIYAWNRSAGLTTVARSDAVRLHLLDSLSIVPFLPASGAIVDLGSGAGLPGIPVAIALANASVTLVEARRRKASFLAESALIALVGGVIGALIALPVNGMVTSTTNWASFSEIAFSFRITPGLLLSGLVFALVMGLVGGFFPARRAAKQPVIQALR